MKVFVAGGTGVLGRRAVGLMVEAGHDVSVIARSSGKAEGIRAAGASPVEVSLFDAPGIKEAVSGHDAVVNLATHIPTITKATKSSAWEENDRIRTEGSRNLVDAVLATGAGRYVQEALAFLYADHGADWIDEDEPTIDAPYAPSMAAAEGQAARVTREGGVGVVLRFGQFYAPEASHSTAMVKVARRGWSMLPGPPDAYLPVIAADDAATAVVAALGAPAGVYNIVDDEPVTRAEWADAMAAAIGRRRLRPPAKLVTRATATRAPNMVSSQRVSNRRFKDTTGWQPRYPSFREGAALLVAS